LLYSLDVSGYRTQRAISTLTEDTVNGLQQACLSGVEWAVGLERLSPLADVAIGGLLVRTILTLIYIPIFGYSVEKKTIGIVS
jgi:hypothetical protein